MSFSNEWGSLLSEDVSRALHVARDAFERLSTRECSCGEQTTRQSGPCDSCSGSIRTLCRICDAQLDRDWSQHEPAGRHANSVDDVCPGSLLEVALAN